MLKDIHVHLYLIMQILFIAYVQSKLHTLVGLKLPDLPGLTFMHTGVVS